MLNILICYDVKLWAYHRRAQALQKYAPADFSVTIASFEQFMMMEQRDLETFDLVFQMDYAASSITREKVKNACRGVPLVIGFNSAHDRRPTMWQRAVQNADFIVVNNRLAFNAIGRKPGTCCISNGVDLDLWRCEVPITQRPHKAIWCGSPRKGKGYQEVLLPLKEIAEKDGFTFDLRPIEKVTPATVYDSEQQLSWYNGASYVLCSSKSEGTPNFLLEAMACGCIPISTRVGNTLEFGDDGHNICFADRNVESFRQALHDAKAGRETMDLSTNAIDTMRNWSYGPPGNRAAWYFALFRALIARKGVKPFCYSECTPEEIDHG